MELPRTLKGEVTPLAVVRAIRAISLKMLAQQIGASWQDVRDWELGEARIPNAATAKRLALALGWRWQDISGEPLSHDEALRTTLEARQRIAEAH